MGGVACSANLTWNDLIGIYWYDEHEPRTTGFTPLGLRRGMDYFVTDSQSVPGEYETNVTHTSALVANRLRELQRLVYQDILQGLSEAGGLASSATELSGAKALIESFVVLGFSQSLEFNDILTSLLFGDERIIEIDKINELCQMGITRTYDTNQNAKVDIVALLNERVNALETLVSNRLTQVQTNGAETLRLVTSTLSRLDVFRAGRNQPTPAPYIAPLGFRLTNGVPNPIFIVWGEPNLRYTVQFTTNIIQSNLTQWVDLPIPADEGTEYATTSAGRSGFHRAVLGP